MTVRSTLLGRGTTTANVYDTAYTCPAGWRTILKSILADNEGQGATSLLVLLQDVPFTINMNLVNTNLVASTTFQWSGWAVLNPGWKIVVYSGSAPVDFWLSGTLLQLTGGEPM